MLPKAHYPPASRYEFLSYKVVAVASSLELLTPEGGISLWDMTVYWTGVPEAAIDEYRKSKAGKGSVGMGGTSTC